MPNQSWRIKNLNASTRLFWVLDDEISDIFYPKGLFLDDDDFKSITERLKKDCSVGFRMACERFLFHNENIDDKNKFAIAARRAYRRRTKRNLNSLSEIV